MRSTALVLAVISFAGLSSVLSCAGGDETEKKNTGGGSGFGGFGDGGSSYGGSGFGGNEFGGFGGGDGGSSYGGSAGVAGASSGGAAGGSGTGGAPPDAGPGPSCKGYCGFPNEIPGTNPPCYCDEYCKNEGDCCGDFTKYCGNLGGSGGTGGGTGGTGGKGGTGGTGGTSGNKSCFGYCNTYTPVPGSNPACFCDKYCTTKGDCCSDYNSQCGSSTGGTGGTGGSGSGTCAGKCGQTTAVPGGCFCDYDCQIFNDCCTDFWWEC